jgi:hypothetical protein
MSECPCGAESTVLEDDWDDYAFGHGGGPVYVLLRCAQGHERGLCSYGVNASRGISSTDLGCPDHSMVEVL